MGLAKGEKIERICQLRVVSIRRESLRKMIDEPNYGNFEAVREGFPDMTGAQFVMMFCDSMRPSAGVETVVTRIEFEYVD